MGIFGSDYESAGVGIPKNAPKKKGAARFFELFFRKFWKLIQVNMLYFLALIPLLFSGYAFLKVRNANTAIIMIIIGICSFAAVIGPATAGMMKILRNYFLERHSFILTDFKEAFTDNYKKSFIVGLIDIIAGAAISVAISVYPQLAQAYGMGIMVLFVISVSMGLMLIMMNFYTFLMIVATDLSLKDILKNSLALALVALRKNILTLFLSLLIAAVFVVMTILNMSTILFLPFVPMSFIAFLICFNSYPVIQKYVINPYYEQKGEVNPELEDESSDEEDEDILFEDKGGSEKPIEKKKNKGKAKVKTNKKSGGKIIS